MTGTSSTVASRINGVPVVVGARCARGSGLLRLPEDLVDLGDLLQQLLGLTGVDGALAAGRAGELGGLVEQLVQLRVLLEVRRLEVVGPQNPEVVLDQLGPLLLDEQSAGAEDRVLVALVLLADGLHRLRFDAGLRRVIDTARQVAVRGGDDARGQQSAQDGSTQHVMPPGDIRSWLQGDTIAVRFPLGRVLVEGPSMAPALRHGDQVVVWWGRRPRPRVGSVLLVDLPGGRGLGIKRLTTLEPP